MGKSWPRAATPCDLVPRWEGEFVSHGDWVNFASKRLTVAYDSNGSELKAICVDSLGRRCANGRDFKRAQNEDTFPVRYFWDCEPSRTSSTAELLEALEKYGRHLNGCNVARALPFEIRSGTVSCTCGFDKARGQ